MTGRPARAGARAGRHRPEVPLEVRRQVSPVHHRHHHTYVMLLTGQRAFVPGSGGGRAAAAAAAVEAAWLLGIGGESKQIKR